jgi:hypothetical protein
VASPDARGAGADYPAPGTPEAIARTPLPVVLRLIADEIEENSSIGCHAARLRALAAALARVARWRARRWDFWHPDDHGPDCDDGCAAERGLPCSCGMADLRDVLELLAPAAGGEPHGNP